MKITLFKDASMGNHAMAKYGEIVTVSDLNHLAELVEKHAYSPALFKNNSRSKENFLETHIIGLDFDAGCSLSDIIERTQQLGFTALFSTTKSHQIEKHGIVADRFRILFPLSQPIDDINVFSTTWKRLNKLYPEADGACKNPDRYFAPSQRHREIFGDFLIPEQKIQNESPKKTISKNRLPETITLCKDVTYFLSEAPNGLNGEFNVSLNKAAYGMARSGISRQLSSSILELVSPEPFNNQDEKTFNSGFDAGEKKGLYPSALKVDPKGGALEDILSLIKESFNDNYVVYEDDQGRRSLILQILSNDVIKKVSKEKLSADIGRLLYDRLGKLYDSAKCDKYADSWIQYSNSITKSPELLTIKDYNDYAYYKLDFNPEYGEHPIFDEFLNRTTNSRALCAFIWSLFEPGANLQQYVWLYGGGGNGKSSLGDFLARLLGPTYMSKNANNAYGNKHFSSSLIGKRLAVFEDSNSVKFVQSGSFKEITGGGQVEVEAKYESSYSAKLACKFLFLSNYEPEISSNRADLRRLILCKVGAITGSFNHSYIENLWEEREAILFTCREAYEELNNNGYIQVDSNDMIGSAADSELAQISIFEEYLKPDGEISGIDLYQLVRGGFKSHGIKMSQFKDWLLREKGVTIKVENRRTIYVGISSL